MSIFPPEAQGLRLASCDWTEWLEVLTPVTQHEGVWVKREDLFAPLGYGGINGSKLRGLIMMMAQRSRENHTVVTGASVRSPQHGMTASVARHLGMESLHVVGATKPQTAAKHVQPQIAARMGAKFVITGGAYNTVLQPKVKELAAGWDHAATIPYGITPEPYELYHFHALGGLQVQNLPDVHTLIVPMGSCNSTASVLLGLQLNDRPTSLRRIVLVGIGPDRNRWLWDRLDMLDVRDGYRYNVPDCLKREPRERNYLELVYVNAYAEYPYDQLVKQRIGDLVLHPTYEAKVVKFLRDHHPHLLCEDSCLWVVGGPQSEEAMERHFPLPHFEELPLWTM